MKKVLRILIVSGIICFFVTFMLIIVNSIMGISVRLGYYSLLAAILTVCLTIGMVLCDSKRIFRKKKAPVNTKSRVTAKSPTKRNTYAQSRKRDIS